MKSGFSPHFRVTGFPPSTISAQKDQHCFGRSGPGLSRAEAPTETNPDQTTVGIFFHLPNAKRAKIGLSQRKDFLAFPFEWNPPGNSPLRRRSD
jgi:hypothetical protein